MMPLRICLDEVSEVSFVGRICNIVKEDISFYNFQDFIVKTDKFLDACGHPQSSIDKRSMDDVDKETNRYQYKINAIRSVEELNHKKGLAKTFDMHVYTRSVGDWQGEIISQNNEKTSFINILDLMNQVINGNT